MRQVLGRVALPFSPVRRSGLRARITISFVSVTVGSVLSFTILTVVASELLSTLFSDIGDRTFLAALHQQAQLYALSAAVQAQDSALNPQTNFIPGQPYTLVAADHKYQGYQLSPPFVAGEPPDSDPVAVGLLVSAEGRVVASSYPARYPVGKTASVLLPEQAQAINRALAGANLAGVVRNIAPPLAYDVEPVLNKEGRPIGALFLQAPTPRRDSLLSALLTKVFSPDFLLLLILVIPVGLFFGWLTTRSLVWRVQLLVEAAHQFAEGDYSRRVVTGYDDEVGQLERQFNRMAGQLLDNITHRQHLVAQNARLAERSRISRELHDAISQDLFSLSILASGLASALPGEAPFHRQIAAVENTTSKMIREMRALLLELRPVDLEHLRLDQALTELAASYRARLGITVECEVTPLYLAARVENSLLRMAQEALSNAARHARATTIRLYLARRGRQVELGISDNGQGFKPGDAMLRYGLGLRMLQERAGELEGSVTIESTPGKGTILTISVPVDEEKEKVVEEEKEKV